MHTEDDIEKASSFLTDFIILRAISFFEENAKIEFLNKKFKDLLENNIDGIYLRAMMTSLVLMKLCNDKSYNTLLPKYKKCLKLNDGFEHDSLIALNEIQDYLEVNY